MAELIQREDSLNTGREKINEAIKASNRAEGKSDYAVDTAETALSNSVSTQTQLDTIVIDGDSSVEAAQARVDSEGNTYSTLKERLDEKETEFRSQLAQIENERLKFVTYDMFKEEGKSDQEVILSAHEYANEKGLPVINPSGEYWIEDLREIPVKTSVNLGNTAIHVDERYNTRRGLFIIEEDEEAFEVEPSNINLHSLSKGQRVIPQLSGYSNHMAFIRNDNGYIIRSSTNARLYDYEFFLIGDNGQVIGDISNDMNTITSIVLQPIGAEHVVIEGGIFSLSGETSEIVTDRYVKTVFEVRRSNTTLKNQEFTFKNDTSLSNRDGFYYVYRAYNVSIHNVTLPAVNAEPGGYSIGGSHVLSFKLSDITGNGEGKWGLIGTNYMRDLYVTRCNVNRIDVHYGAWNIYISDSKIGDKGILLVGGGDLTIRNTTVNRHRLVEFRSDYGSIWDGDILIDNCTLRPINDENQPIYYFIGFSYSYSHDYNKQSILGRTITITNSHFDFSDLTGSHRDKNAYLLTFPNGRTQTDKSVFPTNIFCSNIRKKGREKGLKLIRLYNPELNYYNVGGKFVFSTKEMETNATITFKNIETSKEELDLQSNDSHILIISSFTNNERDSVPNQLIPKIIIDNCDYVNIRVQSMRGVLIVKDSVVNGIDASADGTGNQLSFITLENCDIKPRVPSNYVTDMGLKLSGGSSSMRHSQNFINCVFDVVKVNGQPDYSLTERFYRPALNIENDTVDFNHVNSRLSSSIITNVDVSGELLNKIFMNSTRLN